MDLVVDDNSLNREVLENYLLLLDTTVDHASNGQEALDRIENKTYRIIWLDLKMPKMSGSEFALEARKRGYKGIIVATTGYIDDIHKKKCKDAKINIMLGKPYKFKSIEKIVDMIKENETSNNRCNRTVNIIFYF